MINWNDIKQLDVKDLDLGKFEMPKFEMPKLEMPKFDLPKVDLPKFDFPKFEMPKFEMPKVPQVDMPADFERAAGLARDAAYAGVGAVVITAQKVDERRRELTDQVTTQVRKLVDSVA